MEQTVKKVVTRHNPNEMIGAIGVTMQYEFTMYAILKDHYIRRYISKYGVLRGEVTVDLYGLIVREVICLDGRMYLEEEDIGLISAHRNQLDDLITTLCALEEPSWISIHRVIKATTALLPLNHYYKSIKDRARATLVKDAAELFELQRFAPKPKPYTPKIGGIRKQVHQMFRVE